MLCLINRLAITREGAASGSVPFSSRHLLDSAKARVAGSKHGSLEPQLHGLYSRCGLDFFAARNKSWRFPDRPGAGVESIGEDSGTGPAAPGPAAFRCNRHGGIKHAFI